MQRKATRNSITVFGNRANGATIWLPIRLAAIVAVALSLNEGALEAQQTPPPVQITLDRAIQMALQRNHTLQAARSTIQQSEAEEVTAGLRPNPVLSGDHNFVPVFSPSYFGVPASQVTLPQEGDASIAYTLELWHKRQARLTAAKDQSAVVRSTVTDNERNLIFQVASQFINVLLAESTLDFARQDLNSFQHTVDIARERYRAGDISQGDFLKIQLQLLQFQTDVSTAQLAKIQSLAALRQLLGFESVPDEFDVDGRLDYQPVHTGLDDLKALAIRSRPDLRAAQQTVTGAQSQYALARAIGKPDVTPQVGYSHAADEHTLDFGFSIGLPVFNRNQGEIARARYTIAQSQELARETSQQVLTDVVDAYAALHANGQIVEFYRSGYLDQVKLSLDISEFAYTHGAASLLDFLDAERTYRANQLAYRQTLASYMTALEQMRQAAGTRNLP